MGAGIVYLVGAGPGDPGLLTITGKRCLQKADAVVYDRLVSNRILRFARKGAQLIDVGKESGRHAMAQEAISSLLVELGLQGKRVVRLKGGDPFVFGRGAEEINALQAAKIPFEVVPGVTSAVAVPAYAGIPLTCRGVASSFTVMTGHSAKQGAEMVEIPQGGDTLVILMGMENLRSIADQLVVSGRDKETPVAVIRCGTTADQEVVEGTLTTIADLVDLAGLRAPAIIVVGEVVRLRTSLAWFAQTSLASVEMQLAVGSEDPTNRSGSLA